MLRYESVMLTQRDDVLDGTISRVQKKIVSARACSEV